MYIGKEANNTDGQALDMTKDQEFVNEKAVYDFILQLIPEKARDLGIKHRNALVHLKKKVKEGELNFNNRNVKRIISCFLSIREIIVDNAESNQRLHRQ